MYLAHANVPWYATLLTVAYWLYLPSISSTDNCTLLWNPPKFSEISGNQSWAFLFLETQAEKKKILSVSVIVIVKFWMLLQYTTVLWVILGIYTSTYYYFCLTVWGIVYASRYHCQLLFYRKKKNKFIKSTNRASLSDLQGFGIQWADEVVPHPCLPWTQFCLATVSSELRLQVQVWTSLIYIPGIRVALCKHNT